MIKVIVALFALVVITGCGKSSQEQDKAEKQADSTGIETVKGRPEDLLSPALRDTLRRLKEENNITRDEYWDDVGGVLANDFFEVWYTPGKATVTHGMRMIHDGMRARGRFGAYFGVAPAERLVVKLPPTMEDYTSWTGREWWYYAEIKADTMTMQPLYILVKRGLIDYATAHEYYQWAMGKATNHGAPRWLEEGFASYLSGEEPILVAQMREFPKETHAMSPQRVEEVLVEEKTRQESRIAYYHAYRMVKTVVDRFGEDKLKDVVLLLGQGHTRDEAFRKAFGLSYEETLAAIVSRPENI